MRPADGNGSLHEAIELMIIEINMLRELSDSRAYKISELTAKNEAMVLALEFYACSTGHCDCKEMKEQHGDVSCGFVARKALEKVI